ncbi:DALR anticodon-binding domain-containing protein 3 isoform X1 [Xenopus tropicalis]|uniref:DALR anticodon-binding domain-containing 3 n=1 Tax=Xenopus tropicalis TaxID=8364 RepID=A0A6I8RU96_XENTR|nr:DALR anticodon-binding domain-containing protein 3 isoform X1 [Xenopus tropicalis]|eukprot:XP_012815980.1 PREDICTED: DALR anticodon-binding domain-containing protein 3 isoform X1 [Xenopus tropicalis]
MDTKCCGAEPVRVSEALRALSNAVQGSGVPPTVWFKESSPRNLKSRDFLVPRGALKKLFPDGEVPEDLLNTLKSLNSPGMPPIRSSLQSEAGLVIQLDRPAVFQRLLTDYSPYLRPAPSDVPGGQNVVILNCSPLHACRNLDSLRLSHLRAALITDHLAELLRLTGATVQLIPAVQNQDIKNFLHQLGVSWPSVSEATSVGETVSAFKQSLKECIYVNCNDGEQQELQDETPRVLFNMHLRPFIEEQHLSQQGYDPNLDAFLVSEEDLEHVAWLQTCVQECQEEAAHCTVLHVVSCEDEFHQQKLDLLWRILDPGATTQKHLICGPVRVLNPLSPVSCAQYFHIRKSQMQEASVMKYGDSVQGNRWDEIITCLASAAIKFEMMSTAHRSQVTLDLEDTNITTKGTKSGAFVMYNCARLATMFESYSSAVQKGLYPEFPSVGDLNYSTLREEGEWLLLFNYILPFPEVLAQSVQISLSSRGIRVTANTEAVCKFLVNLSMDFSSYYNRVHILGEPLSHLFGQMFARLQLMKAIQSVLHSALDTLHILPLNQI